MTDAPTRTIPPPGFLADPALQAILHALPNARLVGGCVRDALANRPVADIDLATPDRPGKTLAWTPLRVIDSQVERLEREIDQMNAELSPLTSFILPGGSPASVALHQARTVCRRAERDTVRLAGNENEAVSQAALKYQNRLSDLLFVAARFANAKGAGDVLWAPGATR